MQEKEVNSEQVRDFFDDHAVAYKSKYEKGDHFYNYFFYERLEKATKGLDLEGKTILDIGAGTGPLYDFFSEKGRTNFQRYEATDISSGMMSQSNIPPEHQHIGDFTAMQFDEQYDLIFMLGVSTYLSVEQMKSHIDKVLEILAPGGFFIVTFTHGSSLDIAFRTLLTPVVKLFSGKDKIISQGFQTKYYSKKEISKLVAKPLKVRSIEGLNHTVFPISRSLKGFSIWLAKRIATLKEGNFKHWMSSDLLVKISLE